MRLVLHHASQCCTPGSPLGRRALCLYETWMRSSCSLLLNYPRFFTTSPGRPVSACRSRLVTSPVLASPRPQRDHELVIAHKKRRRYWTYHIRIGALATADVLRSVRSFTSRRQLGLLAETVTCPGATSHHIVASSVVGFSLTQDAAPVTSQERLGAVPTVTFPPVANMAASLRECESPFSLALTGWGIVGHDFCTACTRLHVGGQATAIPDNARDYRSLRSYLQRKGVIPGFEQNPFCRPSRGPSGGYTHVSPHLSRRNASDITKAGHLGGDVKACQPPRHPGAPRLGITSNVPLHKHAPCRPVSTRVDLSRLRLALLPHRVACGAADRIYEQRMCLCIYDNWPTGPQPRHRDGGRHTPQRNLVRPVERMSSHEKYSESSEHSHELVACARPGGELGCPLRELRMKS